MSDFLPRLDRNVSQRHLLAPGRKILAAVSGGVDSMVLLHALNALAREHRWKIVVAHFNHHLRGRASDADEQLVRQTAAAMGWPLVAGGADIRPLAAQSGLSLEMAARKWRHEFLARAAAEHRIATMALAHHADDQVELFFLRLLRGAGGEGLAGMKWRSPSPANPKIWLVRPLLDFSKAELLAYARASHVRFRDDATNFATDILRNRIRHELLPRLRKQYQPGVDKAVLRLMDIVGAEAGFAAACAREYQERQIKPGTTENGGFDELSLAVQRRVLQQQLAGLGLPPDFELIEQLRQAPGRKVSVGAGLTVARTAAGKVACQAPRAGPFQTGELRLKLAERKGRVKFGGREIRWQQAATGRMPGTRQPPAREWREFFDSDRVGDQVILRHWRSGDRFQPIGMPAAAKLQDLFVNAKIPAARRRELVLAATATGEIFWVEGLRIGEAFKLTPQTRRRLAWRVRCSG